MRVAVSGSHGTGKSTLIAAFLERRPRYAYEPEAFETLGDDIDLTSTEGPTPEGLQMLLEYTTRAVMLHGPGACVIYERSPVDYLAYAAASRDTWPKHVRARFIASHVPEVRASLRRLDLIALVPVSATGPVRARAQEGVRFRRRVDESLRRALIDDDYDLLGEVGSPQVVELTAVPERQLLDLLRLTASTSDGEGHRNA
jgi:AAA domain-containing protein